MRALLTLLALVCLGTTAEAGWFKNHFHRHAKKPAPPAASTPFVIPKTITAAPKAANVVTPPKLAVTALVSAAVAHQPTASRRHHRFHRQR